MERRRHSQWPTNLNGKRSYRVMTLRPWMESHDNFNTPDQEELLDGDNYFLAGRSVLLMVEK